MKVINVEKLSFSYDQESLAVQDVSFSVDKGSYTTIIGHNGSGKSTIAKLLIGLLEKTEGEITIDGLELNIKNIQNIRNKVGIVFQNPDNQFIGATVRDDIAFGLENHCIPQVEMSEIIETHARKVNMENFLDSEPTKLSGGQKQRVAIAGVLAMKPDVLIFDEATSMLDPQGKSEIKAMIQEINKENKITVISITHDIEEVVFSDHVLVMDKGKVVMDGKPEEILCRKKELIELALDIPFAFKVQEAFEDEGIILNKKMTKEGMVEELCQFVSKN